MGVLMVVFNYCLATARYLLYNLRYVLESPILHQDLSI